MAPRRKAPRRRAKKSFNVSAIELGTALSLSQSTGAAQAIQTALSGNISGALTGMQTKIMADKNIRLRISETGAKEASRAIGRVDGRLKSLGKTAATAAAAFFGARMLIQGFRQAVDAAGRQELAERKLQTALGRTSKALLDQASALQKVTTVGDEAIIEQHL